jgi:hypothetical protein
VTLIDAESESEVPIASKEEIAGTILDRVDRLRQPGARSGLY